MKFAPIGVFALVAKVIAGMDANEILSLASTLGWFFLSVILALATHVLVVLPLMLKFIAKVSPKRHFQAMAPALLTVFSTVSSSATLPLTMECVEKMQMFQIKLLCLFYRWAPQSTWTARRCMSV